MQKSVTELLNRRKTVVFWCPYFGHIGTIKAVLNLSRGLADLDQKIIVLRVYSEWKDQEEYFEKHNIELVDFKLTKIMPWLPKHGVGFRISMVLLSIFSLPKLIRFYNDRNPDVVIACLLTFLPFLARRFSRIKPKILVSVQGLPHFNSLRVFLWKKFQSNADGIITLTDRTKSLIVDHFGNLNSKISVIKNPLLDCELLNLSKLAPEFDVNCSRRPIILGVGRLTRQKDFSTLIRAFSYIVKNIPSTLIILGEGEQREELAKLVRILNLQDCVMMPGYVQNPYPFFKLATVFALTSLWEDPGHVLIEAAFLGVPIVATDCPSGPREVLKSGSAGLLIPVGDVEGLAKGISYLLLNQEEAQRYSKEAKESVKDYSVESSSKQYLDLISAL